MEWNSLHQNSKKAVFLYHHSNAHPFLHWRKLRLSHLDQSNFSPPATEKWHQAWRVFTLVKPLCSNDHGRSGQGSRGSGVGEVPATDLCRFLFFRFLWLLWWLPEEVEEAAFWGFTPCTDPSRSSGSSWLGSFSWLWKSGEVSLSVPLPGSPGGNKHKSQKRQQHSSGSLSVSQERCCWALTD